MAYSNVRSFGVAVCRALGLDETRVKRIVLDLAATDLPMAEVTLFVDDQASGRIEAVLRAYDLQPVERALPPPAEAETLDPLLLPASAVREDADVAL